MEVEELDTKCSLLSCNVTCLRYVDTLRRVKEEIFETPCWMLSGSFLAISEASHCTERALLGVRALLKYLALKSVEE
jgi:hypothetical protein